MSILINRGYKPLQQMIGGNLGYSNTFSSSYYPIENSLNIENTRNISMQMRETVQTIVMLDDQLKQLKMV